MLYFDICMFGILHLLAVIVRQISSEISYPTEVSPSQQVSICLVIRHRVMTTERQMVKEYRATGKDDLGYEGDRLATFIEKRLKE